MRRNKNLDQTKVVLKEFLDQEQIASDIKILLNFGLESATILRFAIKMQSRWDVNKIKEAFVLGKELNKNKKTLFYDEQYVSLSNNVSLLQAREIIQDMKVKKTTNLQGFIVRHGEEKGKELFEKFKLTSKSSTDVIKQNLEIKYGNQWQQEWINYNKNNSRRCSEFYISRNLASSEEEAKKLVIEYQLNTSGVHLEYYLNRGYSEQDIKDFLDIINAKKKLHKRNRNFLKQKYGNKWLEVYEKSAAEYRKKMEDRGAWIKLEDLDEWTKYRSRVEFLTEQSIRLEVIPNIENRSNEWHLDHIFSIKQGFVCFVEPEIIASPVNLRIISQIQNCSKQARCDISLKDLYCSYTKWKNKYEN